MSVQPSESPAPRVFGIDAQITRSVLALAEGSNVRSVGDGRRHLVPNACTPDGLWGSLAAESRLRALDGDEGVDARAVDLTAHLDDWCCDPLDPSFLRGLLGRLDAYVGGSSRVRGHDRVCVVAVDELSARYATAGLSTPTVVAPTDALVCRWLNDPRTTGSFEGRVLSVACGEEWTDIAAYEVTRLPGTVGVVCKGGAHRAAAGFGTLSAELAGRVLQRAKEGVAAESVLTVLDGTWEFGAELAAAEPDDEVAWDKSLAGRMYDPLRLSGRQVAQWPAAASARYAIGSLIDAEGPAPALVLVGGIGATWPMAADALRTTGEVWQSDAPAYDLAFGAACWPQLAGYFVGRITRPPAPRPVDMEPALTPGPAADLADERHPLPPWQRDDWPSP